MGKKPMMSSFSKGKREHDRQVAIANTMNVTEAVKMITLYALRRQGWGKKRLKAFSDDWNESIMDVSNGWYSLTDIMETLAEETGLTMEDLKIPYGTDVNRPKIG